MQLKCPYCDAEFEGDVCPNCKSDTSLYLMTIKISDAHYNAGLARAQQSDMTGAIESLNKSLAYNKNNINARNLLGLIHYEIGHIGDAIKEWRVSDVILFGDNPAGNYLQQINKNPRHIEKLNDAVRMYNLSLNYLRQKSEDMAIIQLKKAAEINPKFLDALNLLAFACLLQGDNEKAQNAVERTLSVDVNNPIALGYYNELYPGKTPRPMPAQKTAKAERAPIFKLTPPTERVFDAAFPLMGVITFIIGAICTIAVFYILIMPARIAEKDSIINNLNTSHNEERTELQTQLTEVKSDNERTKTDLLALEDNYKQLESEYSLILTEQKITSTEKQVAEGLYQEAVDSAAAIDTSGLPSDYIERIENIRVTAYPQLVSKYYADGRRFFDTRDYESAQSQLENALRYITPEDMVADEVLFYLGRIAQLAEDVDMARQYYERILNDYPNSNQVYNANTRLNQLP
jgi:tetratricopeptide (TPR) repeat protein